MRDLPTVWTSTLDASPQPGIHRALGTPLLGMAALLLLGGVSLGGGMFVHGTARVWLWVLAALLVLTLAASLMRTRSEPARGPWEMGPWGLLSRLGSLVLAAVAANSASQVDQALMLPALSAPGTYLWLLASWVALLGAVLTLVFGALPPVRSKSVPMGGAALALALTLMAGYVLGQWLPYEHGAMNLTGEPTVPETVDTVVWAAPPRSNTEFLELHPTAHGSLALTDDGLYGVHPGRDVWTWSYRLPGEQPQVVVRAGGEIADVLLPGREAFLSLDTLTGRPVVPPEGSGRPVLDPSGDALVTQVGAHPGDVLWEYTGEEGCLPRAGGQILLGEENITVVGTTVVVSLLCGEGLADPVEGQVARHLLVGLDSASGNELWRHEEAEAQTEAKGGGDASPLAPGTPGDLAPPMAAGVWGGNAVSLGVGVYLDAADGTVLYEGTPLEDTLGDERLVLTDFDADSYVVAVWPQVIAGKELEVRFEERGWDGRVLRATAPVQRSIPPLAVHAQALADAVVHSVDGATVMVQPWDGSPPEKIVFKERLSEGGADPGPGAAPLPQAVPGSVLLHGPAGSGLVGSLG